MKGAVIVGGNGLIGRALVNSLVKEQIPILVIGTKKNIHKNLLNIKKKKKIKYLQIKNKKNFYKNLSTRIKNLLNTKNYIFFNLAWKGQTKLTDGKIQHQLKNINFSCELIKLAHKLNIKKYIAIGSMEEIMIRRYIEKKYWIKNPNVTTPNWYALSKLSAWMQSAFEAYNKRIDFCYARVSIAVDTKLSTNKFVENNFKRIKQNKKIDLPKNSELCNISSTDEICRQLISIAKKGKNNQIYILGTGETDSLENFFYKFTNFINSKTVILRKFSKKTNPSLLQKKDFSISKLTHDTGYKPKETIESLFEKIVN